MKLEPKYRLSLTADQIKILYSDCREGDTKLYLKKQLLKIDAGVVNAGYVNTSPTYGAKQNPLESLGLTDISDAEQKPFVPYSDRNPAALYAKWQNDPLSITSEELELVQTYRWENGLMSPEEAELYESKLFNHAMFHSSM